MIYDIVHVTRFDYAAAIRFTRCNIRLEPIDWPRQRVEEHALHISSSGRCHPALAEAGLAHVTRIVVEEPVRHLIESTSRVRVDRPVPMPRRTTLRSPTSRDGRATAATAHPPDPPRISTLPS